METSFIKKVIFGSKLYFLGIFGLICSTYFPVDIFQRSIREELYILFPLLGLTGLITINIGYKNQQYFIKRYITGIIFTGCGMLNLMNTNNPFRLISVILIIGGWSILSKDIKIRKGLNRYLKFHSHTQMQYNFYKKFIYNNIFLFSNKIYKFIKLRYIKNIEAFKY